VLKRCYIHAICHGFSVASGLSYKFARGAARKINGSNTLRSSDKLQVPGIGDSFGLMFGHESIFNPSP
jgi:hypothetical protein